MSPQNSSEVYFTFKYDNAYIKCSNIKHKSHTVVLFTYLRI